MIKIKYYHGGKAVFSVFLCEKDYLVRFDIIELVQNCFADAHLHISDSLKSMTEDLKGITTQSVVMVSGTTEEINDFFAHQADSRERAFVVIGDEYGDVVPEGHYVATVAKPFSSEVLSNGIKSAICALRSSRP